MNVLIKSATRGGTSLMRTNVGSMIKVGRPSVMGTVFAAGKSPAMGLRGCNGLRGISYSLALTNKATTSTADSGESYKPPVTIDRELPDPFVRQKQNRYYFIVYGIGVTVSCIITFNYEKTRSPITSSTLFFLRRAEISKTLLGNGIDYASSWPWISGPLNTVKGDIDISFAVKGDKNDGTVRLKATRENRTHPFVIHHFVLDVEGKEYDLTKDKKMDFGLD